MMLLVHMLLDILLSFNCFISTLSILYSWAGPQYLKIQRTIAYLASNKGTYEVLYRGKYNLTPTT